MDLLPVLIHDYKVLIRCYTFNHSRYIEHALNGFVGQQTNFPFVCLIVDDASTDGEQKVIKSFLDKECDMDSSEYNETDSAEIFIAPHHTNRQCTMVIYFLKENHFSINRTKRPYVDPWRDHCKYEAMCEGDDYWIDPQKLQKQVDFMESHPDYSMCFHSVNIVSEDNKKLDTHLFSQLQQREYDGNEIIDHWIVPTCSVLVKQAVIKNWPSDPDFVVGDNVLFLTAASLGRCFCINEKMGVYRRGLSGWVSKNYFVDSKYRMIRHMEALLKYFPQFEKGINSAIARYYASISYNELASGKMSFVRPFMTGLIEYRYAFIKNVLFLMKVKVNDYFRK